MSKKNDNNVELLPILLDGKPYTIDPSGSMAINTDGKAVMLFDKPKDSRFK